MFSRTIFTLLLLVYLLSNSLSAKEFGPRDFSEVKNKWTAIVAAYAPEINAINQAFSRDNEARIERTESFRGVTYQIGHYKGEPVVIFTTGVSVPNAAMTMQMALDYFPIDKVVMMGIAGAISPEFTPGDIAVPERWYFHDESVYVNPAESGEGDYILPDYYSSSLVRFAERSKQDPDVPDYANFGFIHPNEVSVVKNGWKQPRKQPYFRVSKDLLELTRKAISKMPAITMPSGKPIKVKTGGNGVTGSVFLDNAEYRQWVSKVFSADVAEMESAAVGQVCFVNDIDWVVIRSVSDLAGGQQGKNHESVFDAIASGTGTKLLMALLNEIVDSEKL